MLLALSIAGLALVLGHHHGTVPVSPGWLSPAGTGGAGSAAAGFLVAVFMFTGWDGTLYVNEEVTNRHRNPGRAAIAAVIILGVIYTLCTAGLQGTVPAKALHDNSASALVYTAQAIGGPGWAKAMALALALSVIATTGIVLGARIVYGMASRRRPAAVPRRRVRPVRDAGLGEPADRRPDHRPDVGIPARRFRAVCVYRCSGRDRPAVRDLLRPDGAGHDRVLPAAGLLRSQRCDHTRVLPLGAVAFLGWVFVRSLGNASWAERWSLAGVVGTGVVVMAVVRVFLRPAFFSLPRESDASRH